MRGSSLRPDHSRYARSSECSTLCAAGSVRTSRRRENSRRVLTEGLQRTVEAITAEDLRGLYDHAYRREHAVLAVVGGFEPEAVLEPA